MFQYKSTYKDYNGKQRTEVAYFHFSKQELIHLQASENGGMADRLQRIVDEEDNMKIVNEIREIVLLAYGKKSDDGSRFYKNDQIRADLEASPIFDEIYMKMFQDPDFSGKFIAGVLPEGLTQADLRSIAGTIEGDGNVVPIDNPGARTV